MIYVDAVFVDARGNFWFDEVSGYVDKGGSSYAHVEIVYEKRNYRLINPVMTPEGLIYVYVEDLPKARRQFALRLAAKALKEEGIVI